MYLTDETSAELIRRLEHAHEKHGRFDGTVSAFMACQSELQEVWQAYSNETPQRVYEECLDAATVMIRYAEQMRREGVV